MKSKNTIPVAILLAILAIGFTVTIGLKINNKINQIKCKAPLPDSLSVFETGTLGEDGSSYLLVYVPDEYDWDCNQYWDGENWNTADEAIKFEDTCTLKESYNDKINF